MSKIMGIDMDYTRGVPCLPRPRHITIGLTPRFKTCCLNVVTKDNMTESLPISKGVAAWLLAEGYSAEG